MYKRIIFPELISKSDPESTRGIAGTSCLHHAEKANPCRSHYILGVILKAKELIHMVSVQSVTQEAPGLVLQTILQSDQNKEFSSCSKT